MENLQFSCLTYIILQKNLGAPIVKIDGMELLKLGKVTENEKQRNINSR